MGIACSKVMCDIDNGDGTRRSGRRNQVEASKNWQKYFSVDLECYCVPTDRVLTRDINTLDGPGAECRTVAVTTIHVDRTVATSPQNQLSALNSVVYTPVIQWFGIDVHEQVPKYLPMNLWTGSYTVFGFYKPEEASSAYVTLTAKIGTEELCLEKQLNTKKSLSAEQWSNITRCLEKELEKLPSRITVDHKTAEVEKTVDEDVAQRSSQDTGYTSRRITPNQSPFSYKYTDLTSDSDDATLKEKQIKGKRLRLRRKDTPAINIHPLQFSVSFKDGKNPLRESPLAEEADVPDSPSMSSSNFPIRRSVSSYKLDATTDAKAQDDPRVNTLSTQTALKASKSYQDIPDILSPEPFSEFGTQAPDFESAALKSPNVSRKKKRSLATKIGEMTSPVIKESHDDKKEQQRHSDVGSEADDEESTLTDSDKLSKRVPLSESYNMNEEMATLSPRKVAEAEQSNSPEKEDLVLDQNNEQCDDDQDNIVVKVEKGKSECDFILTEEKNEDTDEFKIEMSQATVLPDVGISEQLAESVNAKVSINAKTSEPNEKVSDKNKTLPNIAESKLEKVKSMEKKEHKANPKILKKTPARTDSSARLVQRSFSKPEKDKKTEDYKLKRTNKSISYSSRAAYTQEKKNQSIELETYLETDSAPPSTPKEAFSDTN